MLLCKGKGCRYRRTCRRYVIGQAIENLPKPTTVLSDGKADTWIDHCLNAKKFEKYIPVKNNDHVQKEA